MVDTSPDRQKYVRRFLVFWYGNPSGLPITANKSLPMPTNEIYKKYTDVAVNRYLSLEVCCHKGNYLECAHLYTAKWVEAYCRSRKSQYDCGFFQQLLQRKTSYWSCRCNWFPILIDLYAFLWIYENKKWINLSSVYRSICIHEFTDFQSSVKFCMAFLDSNFRCFMVRGFQDRAISPFVKLLESSSERHPS